MKHKLSTAITLLSVGAFIMGILVVSLAGCGGGTIVQHSQPMMPHNTSPSGPTSPQSVPGQTTRVFTLQELATYNGQNGQPAYIAVDGVVYDVTGQPDWPMGNHQPCGTDAMAGHDLTQVLNGAPPVMRTYVQRLPVVGTLSKQ